MSSPTVADLKARADNTPDAVRFSLADLSTAQDPVKEFFSIVDVALTYIVQELTRNPKHYGTMTEDQLSNIIVMLLKTMGLDATHDTEVGGHCDIVIEGWRESLWLGEAKLIDGVDNSHLWGGFQQLNTRYATGNVNQNKGGLLIYCTSDRIPHIMQEWQKHLTGKVQGIKFEECSTVINSKRSTHTHERSSNMFYIRHLPVNLYFEPKK